jgi:flagellar assembly protein FliH
MLSKVLPPSDGEIQPVVWRTGNSGAAPTAAGARQARQPAAAPAPTETTTASAEFEAQVHQQLEAAFEAGRREGETARQKLEAEVRTAVERLALTTAEVAAARSDAIRRAETDIVQLSIEIARRVLHREVSVDREALSALVRAALDKLASQQVCRVRVHPDQESMVRAALGQLGRGGEVEVMSDATQSRGGALFETENGALDASVETQLQEIERGLVDRLQERA